MLAVVADASALALDALVDAAFAGRTGELEVQFGKAQDRRHVARLDHLGRAAPGGAAAQGAARGRGRPLGRRRRSTVTFVHFSRKAAVERRAAHWSSARLARAMAQLADAALDARKQAVMAEAIAQRTLLSLAVNARRKE